MLRTWPALLIWGAGLLHLALGASALAADGGPASLALAVALLLLGTGELAWGAAVLRVGRILAPRAAAVGAMVAAVLGGLALAAGSAPLAVAIASALAIASGATSARAGRAASGSSERAAETRTGAVRAPERGRAVGTMVGAVLVAALTTPGLAVTDPGLNGQPHGHEMSVDMPMPDPHQHH